MHISKESMESVKKLYKKKFNEELTDTEAYECGSNLVSFVKTLMDIEIREHKWKASLNNGRFRTQGFCITHTQQWPLQTQTL